MKELRCSRCDGPRDRDGQRYCRACHALNMRAWRAERAQMLRRLVETARVGNVSQETFEAA